MIPAKLPENETERLASLRDLEILDTELEKTYDEITKLAAKICEVPICLISLIDEDRQWFKSRYGLDAPETPRDLAFCAHAILQDDIFEIHNSLEDERFFDNPLATGAPHVVFYAGAVLKDMANHNLGTLCVIDEKPKKLTEFQKDSLKVLARQVVTQFELRRHLKKFKEALDHEEKLNESQLRFFASMGHEIRTPLNGILGMAQLIEDSVDNEEHREYATTIQTCGKDLMRILNDLLDVSKIESGKIEIEKIQFDIIKASEEVVKLFQPIANEKNLELAFSISSSVPKTVNGDPTRVKQVLINLVSNSLKFTDDGRVSVALNFSPDKGVLIQVKDTGAGMNKEQLESVFNPFEQGSSSINRTHGGTGLGLPICSKLVSLMGGEIDISSTQGQGTSVNVSLPLI